tara:strand:+ start:47 stop:280 length:234 start_codon:yes stop_codon:yes gene_type:complete
MTYQISFLNWNDEYDITFAADEIDLNETLDNLICNDCIDIVVRKDYRSLKEILSDYQSQTNFLIENLKLLMEEWTYV